MKHIYKIVCVGLALVCVLCLAFGSQAAEAQGIGVAAQGVGEARSAVCAGNVPSAFFLKQEDKTTCTLCSATMMLRSAMYLHGDHSWAAVSESSVRPVAWAEGAGLQWSFAYSVGNSAMQVAHQSVSGISLATLKSVLDRHPEGIVLYCGKLPHAVFLMGYEGNTLYCAETTGQNSGRTIPLSSSTLAFRYGSVDAVLRNVTAYWYVSDYRDTGRACSCQVSAAGTYQCIATTVDLRIRSGHGTQYSVLGYIPGGATVLVSKASDGWAHIVYNGISGYVSMDYLEKVSGGHYYESSRVEPTCGSEGYTLRSCTCCGYQYKENVAQAAGHSYGEWQGNVPGGQKRICTRCGDVEFQGSTSVLVGTVTASSLRVRAEAGTNYPVVGAFSKGARVEIFERKLVGNVTWGRVNYGWICLDYIELNELPAASVWGVVDYCTTLRVRENAGTNHAVVGSLSKGTRVEILEQKKVGVVMWGCTKDGWISLSYVRLDAPQSERILGTIDYCTTLRVREDAGTSNRVVGYLNKGSQVEILEKKMVGSVTWGRTKDGWISLSYVRFA